MEWVADYWPLVAFGFALAVQWGVNEARIRGLQYQINAMRDQQAADMTARMDGRETLARVDERTKAMADRMERIENQLNGKR